MDEQNTSPLLDLWRYFRTKGRNAVWVLKTKGLHGVWRNFTNEIMWLSGRYIIHQANAELQQTSDGPPAPKAPDSAFTNRRKMIPPSPRPTKTRIIPAPLPEIDRVAIAQAIGRIKDELRHSSEIKGKLHHGHQ